MITISGKPLKQSNLWPLENFENKIIHQMQLQPVIYSYNSIDELSFELKLRRNIVDSAKAMSQGYAKFEILSKSYCNPRYWNLTKAGGFQLKAGVLPSEAIQDIYNNSSLYAFECATAIVIIYYHAVLNSIGEHLFNQTFQNLYLYSWNSDSDLGIQGLNTNYLLPGDVVYFNNPEFDPNQFWFKGENAVLLEDGTFFGHGIGIETAEKIIEELNKARLPMSMQSAYLTNYVLRLSFNHLFKISKQPRSFITHKMDHAIVHHNETSIAYNRYLFHLYRLYNQIAYGNIF